MANEPVQNGTDIIVGFGSFSWSGFLPEDGLTDVIQFKHTEALTDLNGNARTKVRAGRFRELAGTFTVDSPNATFRGIKPGNVIAITGPGGTSANYEVQEWSVSNNRHAAQVSCRLRKEDAMTYTVPS
jgi:hypothetical protein